MHSLQWRLAKTEETIADKLAAALDADPLIGALLVQRGIRSAGEALAFFHPDIAFLHDPWLMKDMDRAAARLETALQRGEQILLYGDYDVDGTTSVAMMYAFLSRFGARLDYYLPDRDREGYGVSLEGVEYARAQGCALVIAMDCGIKANAAVALAAGYGIDFIVCDHHVPEGELPAAVANLDPKRSDCPYPYKDLSGCGIAFKLAQALLLHRQLPESDAYALLDFVAVSAACDIMPMTGENRVLTHFGLQQLYRAPRPGFWALGECMNRPKPFTVSDLVFGLGPMINSAGRLGDARDAVRLLLSADNSVALREAQHLAYRNNERKKVDYAMADAARRQFKAMPDWESKKSIVLFRPDWHKGIIGISASRIAEDFHKPTVILTKSNGRAVGSARSVRGFDLYAALQRCEDLFFSYGGHAHAAGMQMPLDQVEAFAERFETVVADSISRELESPVLDIAGKIELNRIDDALLHYLRLFEPHGPSNLAPVFWAEGVTDTGQSRLLDNNHVRFSLRQNGSPVFTGIGFGLGAAFQAVKGAPFDIAFNIKEEYWKGMRKTALYVKDLRVMPPKPS